MWGDQRDPGRGVQPGGQVRVRDGGAPQQGIVRTHASHYELLRGRQRISVLANDASQGRLANLLQLA